MLAVGMFKPANETDHRFGVVEHHHAALPEALLYPSRQPRRVQEDCSSHLGVVAVKTIADNINGRDAGAFVIRVHGNAPNLPALLHLQSALIPAVADYFPHSLFQIALARSDQQDIIHVAEIVCDPVCTLPTAQLTHILLDVMVKRLQKEVGEPLRRVCPDGDASRDAVYDLVNHIQHEGIFDDSSEISLEKIMVDVLIEFADVQLHEVLCLWIQAHPLLHGLPGGIYATPRDGAIGMLIHSTHDNVMDGLHEHPVYYVVSKAWAVDIPLLPIDGLHNQVPHL